MTKNTNKHGSISVVYEGKTHEDLHTCLFTCFLSQEEPKIIAKALSDPAWVEAIQEKHLQFKLQKMDVKSAFLYGTIEEEVKQREDGIFISQDKYVAEILKKFGFTDVRTASTLMDTEKPFLKNSDGDDVDVHLYRSMIGSLLYLTSSRPDIMYLKGQPKLALWYPKSSPFDPVAYSDSDYARESLDRKSTTRGCQFLGCRLISWQCKKQTVVATYSIEAEYVAAASCC
ncbi:hypothetical protein Tco_1469480 [Tanacetum coccineum]